MSAPSEPNELYIPIYKLLEPMRSVRRRDGMGVSLHAEQTVIAAIEALIAKRERAARIDELKIVDSFDHWTGETFYQHLTRRIAQLKGEGK